MKRKKLKLWRVGNDLTQEQLGESLGVTVGYINQIELGKIKPSLRLLETFKNVYKFKTLNEVIELFDLV